MNQITETQTASGSVDPLAQLIVDTIRKSGGRAWLGFPPPEEMEQLRAEKAERDFKIAKRRLENQDRKRAELKERAREVIQRNRDEQV
ncbi:MAG: hypothetical protein ABSH15_08510 [Verrucomicrobiota bacterium]|jgi:hypothetical protein